LIMKCITLIILFVAVWPSLSTAAVEAPPSQTQGPTQIIIGTIVSIDAAKNEVVVTNTLGGWTKTITVPAIAIPSLSVNRTIQLTILKGTSTAVKVAYYRHRTNKKRRQEKAARQKKGLAAAEASKKALGQTQEQ